MARIPIDVDGCSTVDEAVHLCGRFGVECLILRDTSHHFEKMGARTLVVSKGADSVDPTLINLLRLGDVVVAQDYGLVAICTVCGAQALNQDGMEYTAQNIDALLLARHIAKKIRSAGNWLKGPCKRLPERGQVFYRKLARLLGEE